MPFSSQPRNKKGTAQSDHKAEMLCDHSVPKANCPKCSKPKSNVTHIQNAQDEKKRATLALEQIKRVLEKDPKAIERASKILAFWVSKK